MRQVRGLGPPQQVTLVVDYQPVAVVVFSASPFPVRACRKMQLAMQEQDTILDDGQAGHVDGLGSGYLRQPPVCL